MKALLQAVLLLALLIHLVGCDVFPMYTMVNNTGKPLVLVPSEHGQHFIDSHPEFSEMFTEESTHQLIEIGSSLTIVTPPPPPADFTQSGMFYRYRGLGYEVPREFEGCNSSRLNPFKRYFYVLQIEPDGKIYALYPNEDYPVSTLPPQPEGYPLVPTKVAVSP